MANYAHIEDNNITGVYDLIPENWRNISNFYVLKDDSDLLASLGWRIIQKPTYDYDPTTQRLDDPVYTILGDTVIESRNVIDLPIATEVVAAPLTDEELFQNQFNAHALAMNRLRAKRDLLLQETDYTQIADVVELNGTDLTNAYKTYRQTLRDLPSLYEQDINMVDENIISFPTLPDPLQYQGV